MSKYHNSKVLLYGKEFDSAKEARRYAELLLLEKAGEVHNLQCQVPFELIPAQKIDGKIAERACSYVADFTYVENGKLVVEDVKGYKKGQAYALFAIKRKLMLKIHNIKVKEV